ncbi:microsomal glutathione S-transferase 1-like [Syngnathoides biaculeatus]|uniref:microsomal glutathione S-transferase 1-like n=1 Tax=Syngnathoides biaculeatus TaxID=300417 RepID=UPI002ADE51C5|nr:microsomal glutathione S-transferase 1-like [Syngnathoides biaculeatus]
MLDLMQDDVFMAFSTYALIVILKMMIMSPLTTFYRFRKGSFATEEDVAHKSAEERKKLLRIHPDVERVRRCHLNDLENVVPFVMVGLFYAMSGPELPAALLHFRIFAGSRICHTISYIGAFPQPCRALSFLVGLAATVSMAYSVLSKVLVL